MLETPHSVFGAAIGAATGNPYVAAPVSFMLHFPGDALPHWNPQFPFHSKPLYAFVVADFTLALVFVGVCRIFFPDQPEVWIGALGGILPDILLGIRFVFQVRWLRAYERFHTSIQTEVSGLLGILPQLVVTLASVWYLFIR